VADRNLLCPRESHGATPSPTIATNKPKCRVFDGGAVAFSSLLTAFFFFLIDLDQRVQMFLCTRATFLVEVSPVSSVSIGDEHFFRLVSIDTVRFRHFRLFVFILLVTSS
jgi:hypothetical protein